MNAKDEEAKASPDIFGRHEILDRAALLMKLVDEYLMEHQDIRDDEKALATAALDSLFRLYQLVGERHLSRDSEGGE